MMGRQNYDPFLGTLNSRCRTIMGTQTGTIHFDNHPYDYWVLGPLGLVVKGNDNQVTDYSGT